MKRIVAALVPLFAIVSLTITIINNRFENKYEEEYAVYTEQMRIYEKELYDYVHQDLIVSGYKNFNMGFG